MKTALNRCQGRAARGNRNFAQVANDALLASPAGAALWERLDAATTEFYPHRDKHIRQVALTVMRARGEA